MIYISKELLKTFKDSLFNEEKSYATIQKYIRDVKALSDWLSNEPITKASLVQYKKHLSEKYAPSSVNAAIASLNHFFDFCGNCELKLKTLKLQRQIFMRSEIELTKAEYQRLLNAAMTRKNERLYLVMQTICASGIRISELKYVTVEAITKGFAEIDSKGKRRTVFLNDKLCKILKRFAKDKKIKSGAVFVTKNGNPLDRSNIWSDMKKLCGDANVSSKKVFPHNLRHLFARTYYSIQKDIVRLADILGHSSINTTRIYTMESGEIHRKQIQKLGLLRC